MIICFEGKIINFSKYEIDLISSWHIYNKYSKIIILNDIIIRLNENIIMTNTIQIYRNKKYDLNKRLVC